MTKTSSQNFLDCSQPRALKEGDLHWPAAILGIAEGVRALQAIDELVEQEVLYQGTSSLVPQSYKK
ncbi:MAG: hypothetical protein ABSD70_05065 [Terracidiphilus sp.]|jgi:hypothetical protein